MVSFWWLRKTKSKIKLDQQPLVMNYEQMINLVIGLIIEKIKNLRVKTS